MVHIVNLILIGFGNVGKEIAKLLLIKNAELRDIHVKSVISSKGVAILNNWKIELQRIIDKYIAGVFNDFSKDVSIWDVIEKTEPNLALVTIPPSYFTGEPNLSIYKGLLDRDVGFITADKTGLALKYSELFSQAEKKHLFIGYRATVMAGTPAIDLMRGLRGREIKSIRSVLNATTNYVLTLVENGLSYSEAINKAIEEKLAEPDPRIDMDGYDAGAKLVILVNTLGHNFNINDVIRKSLTSISEEEVRRGKRTGHPVKYVASADLEKKTLSVMPEILNTNDPLSSVSGNYNILTIKTDGGEIVLKGFAGPAWITARAMFTDLLEYLEKYSKK